MVAKMRMSLTSSKVWPLAFSLRKTLNIKSAPAAVHHAELWGVRQETDKQQSGRDKITGGKYLALEESDVSCTAWNKLDPRSPFYLFLPI